MPAPADRKVLIPHIGWISEADVGVGDLVREGTTRQEARAGGKLCAGATLVVDFVAHVLSERFSSGEARVAGTEVNGLANGGPELSDLGPDGVDKGVWGIDLAPVQIKGDGRPVAPVAGALGQGVIDVGEGVGGGVHGIWPRYRGVPSGGRPDFLGAYILNGDSETMIIDNRLLIVNAGVSGRWPGGGHCQRKPARKSVGFRVSESPRRRPPAVPLAEDRGRWIFRSGPLGPWGNADSCQIGNKAPKPHRLLDDPEHPSPPSTCAARTPPGLPASSDDAPSASPHRHPADTAAGAHGARPTEDCGPPGPWRCRVSSPPLRSAPRSPG